MFVQKKKKKRELPSQHWASSREALSSAKLLRMLLRSAVLSTEQLPNCPAGIIRNENPKEKLEETIASCM